MIAIIFHCYHQTIAIKSGSAVVEVIQSATDELTLDWSMKDDAGRPETQTPEIEFYESELVAMLE